MSDDFDDLPLFQRHSDTSRDAWQHQRIKNGTKRWLVLCYISVTGGCTDEEGMEGLRMGGNTYRPRRRELEDQYHLVVDSGERRACHSGEMAVVWRIKEGAVWSEE